MTHSHINNILIIKANIYRLCLLLCTESGLRQGKLGEALSAYIARSVQSSWLFTSNGRNHSYLSIKKPVWTQFLYQFLEVRLLHQVSGQSTYPILMSRWQILQIYSALFQQNLLLMFLFINIKVKPSRKKNWEKSK